MKKEISDATDLSPEDIELFRSSIGDVRIVSTNTTSSTAPRPEPRARMRALDDAEVMSELLSSEFDPADLEMGDEIHWLRDGLNPRLLKKLRRGQFSVSDSLDLHLMTQAVAREALIEFISHAQHNDFGCVKVIHGKGLNSGPDGPRLKQLTRRLLSRHPAVLAMASARANDGGTGAAYVLLQRKLVIRD